MSLALLPSREATETPLVTVYGPVHVGAILAPNWPHSASAWRGAWQAGVGCGNYIPLVVVTAVRHVYN